MAARNWKSSTVIRECVAECGHNIQNWPKDDRELVEYTVGKLGGFDVPEIKAAMNGGGWGSVANYLEAMHK